MRKPTETFVCGWSIEDISNRCRYESRIVRRGARSWLVYANKEGEPPYALPMTAKEAREEIERMANRQPTPRWIAGLRYEQPCHPRDALARYFADR